jgi:cold shock CspA family protein
MTGFIETVWVSCGFGFIKPDERGAPDIFFHAQDVCPELEFGEQLQEMRVAYDATLTRKGPRAVNVRPAP